MLIYKQRYKPRTSREFTKSDLTVYDSADNTALNALTVYGKSEVVDGEIKSAGEGWATVRLADLTWSYSSTYRVFLADTSNLMTNTVAQKICNTMPCDNETNYTWGTPIASRTIYSSTYSQKIFIQDTNYNIEANFVASLGDATLCYQLADPSQGNTIAIKTDNGTGIDGTMAVFETGTPLYGVSDAVRDVMQWDGSAGTVTNVCSEVDLGILDWWYNSTYQYFYSAVINDLASPNAMCICAIYDFIGKATQQVITDSPNMSLGVYDKTIRIKNLNYAQATAFKNAMSGVMLIYELATPTTEQLTTAENASIAGLRTFAPQTHAQNNAQTDMTVDYTIKVPTN